MANKYFNINWYNVYRVTKNDEEFYFSGTAADICEQLDITKSCVSKAVKENHLVRRKYKIYLQGEEDED